MTHLPGPTVADLIARFLSSKGVKHVFGMPGGENLKLLDALRRESIEFVLMHHEMSAGFAADVTGQLTGRAGVCLSTVGPGAVNLAAAAAGATLERSPVLAITAEFDPEERSAISHMQVDLEKLFGSIAKGSYSLRPENIREMLAAAWELACSPPRGAVHLALSPAAAAAASGEAEVAVTGPTSGLPDPSKQDLARVKQWAAQARDVLILAGLGVEAVVAQAELLALAEAWNVPVMVTPKAKGHFPESHPLYAGCFTAYGDGPLQDALRAADFILGVGLDGVDFVTGRWNIQTRLVNVDAAGLGDPVTQPAVTLGGDVRATLNDLLAVRTGDIEGHVRASALRGAVRRALDSGYPPTQGFIRLHPLIAGLRAALPEDGAITVDVGVFKLVLLQYWQTEIPRTLFVANGLSAMGYAIPGALAVKLENPGRPVVAVVGDGALHMYAGELATIARRGTPIVILVIVDRALALIRLKQLRMGLPVYGTEFKGADYASLAKAFGLAHRKISTERSVETVLKAALRENGPVLVEVEIPLEEYNHYR